ncbi:glycine cleavage system protein GcvH [Paenibacillus marinisediminis]
MSEVRDQLVYSEEHEWALAVDERTVRIGITDHAQSQLGDIVFIEFPTVGTELTAGDSMGSIESVKTVSELYTPVSGKIVRVNTELENAPERVNEAPYEGGWIAEIEVEGSVEEAFKKLLTAEQYRQLTE